jgi:hypothetical protein
VPTSGARRRKVKRSTAANKVAVDLPQPAPAARASHKPLNAQPQEPKHTFYLVQDLSVCDSNQPGFDGKFRCDYMGSAEYEFGAIPRALKSIRAAGDLIVLPVVVTRGGVTKTIYFVGPRQGMDVKVSDFSIWFSADWPRCREVTSFISVFDGKNFMGHPPFVKASETAWWSLDDEIGWALDEKVAARLLAAFSPAD